MTEALLGRIAASDPLLNAYTDGPLERACARPPARSTRPAAGRPLGPLAGVPFAVKNLFDVEGLPTRAGSPINRERPPAAPTPSSCAG